MTRGKPTEASSTVPGRGPDLDILVGPNLKRLRQERGLSLEALARLADVSRAMLSQIERGASVPTINTVWKLARAFDVPFSALIAEADSDAIHDLPATDALRLESSSGKMTSRALFPTDSPPKSEFYEMRLKPGAYEESEPHPEGAAENLVVSAGALEIRIGNTIHRLAAGDAILFPGDQKHAYRNRGPDETVVYLVITYP
jgi:transcriptional regulator with XRE-family HTH domain